MLTLTLEPWRVGKLKGSGARPYHSSDKPTWLLQTLPTRTSNVVMMVDASDMHLLCGADELLAKRRVLTGGDDNTVVVGGEPILWPDQQKFDGQSLSHTRRLIPGDQEAEPPSPYCSTIFRAKNHGARTFF